MEKLLSLPCFQPHILEDFNDGETTPNKPAAVKTWENWDTRTGSTVQYVGFNNDGKQKAQKQKQKQVQAQAQEEEEEDEVDTLQLAELSKQLSVSRTPQGNEERSGNVSARGGEDEVNNERKNSTGNKQTSRHFSRTSSVGLGDSREYEYLKAVSGVAAINIHDQLYAWRERIEV